MPVFNKKKREKNAADRIIRIYDGGRLIYSGAVDGLPVGEKTLITKSIEFFSDPEPCYIHRSAVQARLYAEFEGWLDSAGAGDAYDAELCGLPTRFAAYFFGANETGIPEKSGAGPADESYAH